MAGGEVEPISKEGEIAGEPSEDEKRARRGSEVATLLRLEMAEAHLFVPDLGVKATRPGSTSGLELLAVRLVPGSRSRSRCRHDTGGQGRQEGSWTETRSRFSPDQHLLVQHHAEMPSFLGIGKKKGQSSSSTASPAYQGSPHSQPIPQASNSHAATAAPAAPSSSSSSSSPSQTHFDIAGLPIIVYGLNELTPSASSSTAPRPPDVCVSFHLHGRGGDAKNEDHICRGIYQRAASNVAASSPSQPARELLVVTFDARNHGHRTTNSLGQKGWGVGNKQHALDLYGMILGNAADVSFLIDLLPAYLFPHDDRRVSAWCVTGKSLGGHAVWHVLKDEPRVTVGVNMIGCPDYGRLLEYRTKQAFLSNGPPHVPRSLKALIQARDPAKSPFDRWGKENP